MKEKRHLVMWVEFIALAVLLARLETVRIRENAKKCRNMPVPGGNRKVRRRGTEKERKKLSVTSDRG